MQQFCCRIIGALERYWDVTIKALMRSDSVEIVNILLDNPMELTFIEDEDMIQTLPPHTP
jgi:hypothetical protein